eukprot:6188052-Pleurochrysis_carterae.AAC.1
MNAKWLKVGVPGNVLYKGIVPEAPLALHLLAALYNTRGLRLVRRRRRRYRSAVLRRARRAMISL